MSNIITSTPVAPTTGTRFSEPTWEVKVNSVTNPKAVLESVVLEYGRGTSSGRFSINEDPDTGTFPAYNDPTEIFVKGRRVIKGKIKGITAQITTGGLRKTFTVLTNITTLQEKVVDTCGEQDFNERGIKKKDRLNAQQILNELLGYIPVGTPDRDPGEIHLTDMTILDAVSTVVSRLGNFRLFWNQDTDRIELYEFGKGGDSSRLFEKGVNILDQSITENRQSKVDKVTIVGPPKQERKRIFPELAVEPDENGVHRLTFTIKDSKPRNIIVEGQQNAKPTVVEQGELEVLPEDMGIPNSTIRTSFIPEGSIVPTIVTTDGFAVWPFFTNSEKYGNRKDDVGPRHPYRKLIQSIAFFSQIAAQPVVIGPDEIQIFVGELPRVYRTKTLNSFVDNVKLGIEGFGVKTSVKVITNLFWTRGSIRATYTKDGDCPEVSVGSGTVERTITDTQYQIIKNNIDAEPNFDNETEILALMQERADSEFKRLNRPDIGGTITVLGDETIDLKQTVVVNGQKLDIVGVSHNFGNGFRTNATVTNEIFIKSILVTPKDDKTKKRIDQQRFVNTNFTLSNDEITVNQDKAREREADFQRRLEDAGFLFAIFSD